jgi:hypothetical protein
MARGRLRQVVLALVFTAYAGQALAHWVGRSLLRGIPPQRPHAGWNAYEKGGAVVADAGRCSTCPVPRSTRCSGAPRGLKTARGFLCA